MGTQKLSVVLCGGPCPIAPTCICISSMASSSLERWLSDSSCSQCTLWEGTAPVHAAAHLNPPCIPLAFPLQPPCTTPRIPPASFLHPHCIPPASALHSSCIPPASPLHPSCIHSVSPLPPSCISPAPPLHPPASPCIPPAFSLYPSCISSASALHPSCTPSAFLLHPPFIPPTSSCILLHPSCIPLHPSRIPLHPSLLHPPWTPPAPLPHSMSLPTGRRRTHALRTRSTSARRCRALPVVMARNRCLSMAQRRTGQSAGAKRSERGAGGREAGR